MVAVLGAEVIKMREREPEVDGLPSSHDRIASRLTPMPGAASSARVTAICEDLARRTGSGRELPRFRLYLSAAVVVLALMAWGICASRAADGRQLRPGTRRGRLCPRRLHRRLRQQDRNVTCLARNLGTTKARTGASYRGALKT